MEGSDTAHEQKSSTIPHHYHIVSNRKEVYRQQRLTKAFNGKKVNLILSQY
jgi:hypothetical protein